MKQKLSSWLAAGAVTFAVSSPSLATHGPDRDAELARRTVAFEGTRTGRPSPRPVCFLRMDGETPVTFEDPSGSLDSEKDPEHPPLLPDRSLDRQAEGAPPPKNQHRRQMLALRAGAGVWDRRLRFHGTTGTVLGHVSPGMIAPVAGLQLALLHMWKEAVPIDVVFDGRFTKALGARTRVEDGPSFSVNAQRLDAGVRVVLELGRSILSFPNLEYRRTKIAFGSGEAALDFGLPRLTYHAVKLGGMIGFRANDEVTLSAGGSHLYLPTIRSDLFRGINGFGYELAGSLDLRVTTRFHILLEGNLTEYRLQFPRPGERGDARADRAQDRSVFAALALKALL